MIKQQRLIQEIMDLIASEKLKSITTPEVAGFLTHRKPSLISEALRRLEARGFLQYVGREGRASVFQVLADPPGPAPKAKRLVSPATSLMMHKPSYWELQRTLHRLDHIEALVGEARETLTKVLFQLDEGDES